MISLGAHVGSGEKDLAGDLSLDAQIPLLNVTAAIMSAVDLRNRLRNLRKKLLGALGAKTATGRERYPVRERQGDRVIRMSSVHRAGVGGWTGIDHVVDRVQRKGNIARHPENSVTAAYHGFWRQSKGQTDPRGKIILLKREVVLGSGRY